MNKIYIVLQKDAAEDQTYVLSAFKDEEKAKLEVAHQVDEACINHSDSEDQITSADELAEQIGLEFWYEETEVIE